MVTRVKICGLRTPAMVDVAVAAGADALGFNLYGPSPRSVSVDEATALAARVPLWVERVALCVQERPHWVAQAARQMRAGTVQLHGEVTAAECRDLRDEGLRVVVAVPTASGQTVDRLASLVHSVDAVLLDAAVPGQHGGTGQRADWAEVRAVQAAYPSLPVILAGGLRPDNVVEAVRSVWPYAVDVASGVEVSPGVQDAERIRAFVAAVRGMERT